MEKIIKIGDVHRNQNELLENLFDTVPFGNSDYQSKMFVLTHIGGEDGSGRGYRQCALELWNEYKAYQNAERNLRINDATCKKLEVENRYLWKRIENINSIKNFFLRLVRGREWFDAWSQAIECQTEENYVKISELKFRRQDTEMLAKDTIRRVEVIVEVLATHKAMSYKEFEEHEPNYWMKRLLNDAANQIRSKTGLIGAGTLESLQRIGIQPAEAEKLTQSIVAKENKLLEEGVKKTGKIEISLGKPKLTAHEELTGPAEHDTLLADGEDSD